MSEPTAPIRDNSKGAQKRHTGGQREPTPLGFSLRQGGGTPLRGDLDRPPELDWTGHHYKPIGACGIPHWNIGRESSHGRRGPTS